MNQHGCHITPCPGQLWQLSRLDVPRRKRLLKESRFGIGRGHYRPLTFPQDQSRLMHRRMPGQLNHRDVQVNLDSRKLLSEIGMRQGRVSEMRADPFVILKGPSAKARFTV